MEYGGVDCVHQNINLNNDRELNICSLVKFVFHQYDYIFKVIKLIFKRKHSIPICAIIKKN